MAFIEESLVSHLNGHAGLNALVQGRYYPHVLEQGEPLPAVTYQNITPNEQVSHGGVSMTFPMLQVSVYTMSYHALKAATKQLKLALRSGKGSMENVRAVFITGAREIKEPDTKRFGMQLTVTFHYREID